MRKPLLAAALILIGMTGAQAVEITTFVARPLYDARLLEIGQSLVDLLAYQTAWKALHDALIADAVSPTLASVEGIQTANGGSYACQEDSPLGGSETNYWMRYNSGTPVDGPLQTAALQEIRARRNQKATSGSTSSSTGVTFDTYVMWPSGTYNVTGTGVSGSPTIALTRFGTTGTFSTTQTISSGTVLTFTGAGLPTVSPPTSIVFDQGQQEVTAAAGLVSGVSAAQALINWTACTNKLFAELQAALPAPAPIYATILGRAVLTGSNLAGAYEALRKTQIAWIAAPGAGVGTVYRTADDYDESLFSNVHPDTTSQPAYGQHYALAIAKHQYSYAGLTTGPTIASCANSGAIVSVSVTPESGDTIAKPTSSLGPWGWAFYDGTTRLPATFIGWTGNIAQWNVGSTPAALHCSYIDDWGPAYDDNRVIRGTTSRLPLQMGYF